MKRKHGGSKSESGYLDFSANIAPFDPPSSVQRVIQKQWKEITSYPAIDAAPFCEAVASHHGIPKTSVLAGNGSSELIYLLIQFYSKERAKIPLPAFTEYEDACEAHGIPVNQGNETITFLGNPNNPDGRLRNRQEILSLPGNLIVDEAFMPFTDERESLVEEASRNPRVIVIRSLTKLYSLPGLRIGYLIAAPQTIRELKKITPPWNCNTFAIRAGIAALQDRGHARRVRQSIQEEGKFLFAAFKEIGLNPLSAAANFILCEVPDAAALCSRLEKRKIFVRNCDSFSGLQKNRHIRVAVRTREDNLMLIAALKEIRFAGKT